LRKEDRIPIKPCAARAKELYAAYQGSSKSPRALLQSFQK